MHKYFLSVAVLSSLILSTSGALYVSAQTDERVSQYAATAGARPANRYVTATGIYAAASTDPITKKGVLTLSRKDEKRGIILTNFLTNLQTVYLRKYGGQTTLKDFKINEELFVYAIRNSDGTATAISVTDNYLWFLDPAINKGAITAVDTVNNTVNVTDLSNNQSYTVLYAADTKILKPKSLPGAEADLVVGKNIRVRGTVRKSTTGIAIEHVYVMWILPDEHNDN